METNIRCQDVMQVCRNGHVITDLLLTYPERGVSHCEQCGATTLDRCPTCGQELPGAVLGPGPVPIGQVRPPACCSGCGAAFPWTAPPQPEAPANALASLEKFLRRVPRVIRQLRVRQGDRPAFRVHDERDLEDLMRSLLPLLFDDVFPECRTASYAPGTSTDFIIESAGVVLTVKRARTALDDRALTQQLQEDFNYYDVQRDGGTLLCLIYDPEGTLPDPRQLEAMWSKPQGRLDIRCVIAT